MDSEEQTSTLKGERRVELDGRIKTKKKKFLILLDVCNVAE
jgi:hypothetical protein